MSSPRKLLTYEEVADCSVRLFVDQVMGGLTPTNPLLNTPLERSATVRPGRVTEKKQYNKEVTKVLYFHYLGEVSAGLIRPYSCSVGDVHDIITCAKFQIGIFMGPWGSLPFSSPLPFPLPPLLLSLSFPPEAGGACCAKVAGIKGWLTPPCSKS